MAKKSSTAPGGLKNPLDGLNKAQVKQLGRAVQRVADLNAQLDKAKRTIADSRFVVKKDFSARESARAIQSARSSEKVREKSEAALAKLADQFKDKPQLKSSLAIYQALEKAAGQNDPAARSLLDEVKADLTIAAASVKRERKGETVAEADAPASTLDKLMNGIAAAVASKKGPKVGELTEHARGQVEDALEGQKKRREPNEFQEPARPALPYPASLLAKFTVRGDEVVSKRTEEVAFVDGGRELRAKGDVGKEIIDAMLDTAASRGWSPIKLFGTNAFKAAAWMEAASRGLDTQGYKPSPEEQAVAAHNRALNGVDNRIAGEPLKEKQPNQPVRGEEGPKKADAQLAGKILDHGESKYNFDEAENPSYFVKLATAGGEKTVWGADLQRALREAGAVTGNQVKLENLGRDAVAVVGALRNEKNEVVGRGPIDTHRNTWKVALVQEVTKTLTHGQKLAKAFEEATTTREQTKAAKQFPELAGAFAAVKVFEKNLNVTAMPKTEARDFSEQVRGLIAERLASGKSIPSVEVRDQEKQRERSDDREQ
ncbi:LPD7 domain-containing protein [Stenotrophomonas oahuensis]|uniref:Large polyvalent protein-associated domain-containing protein n=1 Tax=Stenotrophomonas oahuensis TaxID=3003271 RepID=A0ABY9YV31_9GAMM|nr:LPD7 domain-containing protein [Stenotrophomonas sp. A5586]WNH54844.1 hypothetical protein PDM29_20740 [Stenotrophomonas sp. A5586]